MALLDKLALQGVRSFGADESDLGVIKFGTPLTLILGDNGCGKTTIIESLKYAICGELPGNSKNGSGFVHDPKLGMMAETRAKLMLQVLDTKGKKLVVTRTFKTTQKSKKLEFQTVDNTITARDENGQPASISGKCADINKEMCLSLGVSKAVLDHVIFCHQEDSDWPLEGGKQLKERFDAIFDAVKYNKCLDHIKKLQKEYKEKVRACGIDLKYLLSYKEEASNKRGNLTSVESRIAANKDIILSFQEKISPIQERLNELAEKENHISKLHTEYETLKIKLEETKKSIQEYKKGIQFEFSGTDEELSKAIDNFQQDLCEKREAVDSLEKNEEFVLMEQKRLQQLISEEQKKLGQLMRDFERHKEKIDERNKSLLKICEDLKISTSLSHLSQGDELSRIFSSVEESVTDSNNELNSLKNQQDEKVSELQKEIDKIREEGAKLKQIIEGKRSSLARNKDEIKKIKADIEEVDQSAEKLGHLQAKLDRVKKELEELNQASNIEELNDEIKKAEKSREQCEDNLTVLEREIDLLQSYSSIQAELDVQKETKSSKESEIKKLKIRHEESLKHLLKEIPEQGIKFQLQSCMDRLADEIKLKREEAKNLERKISALEIEKTHLAEKYRSTKQAYESDECTIKQACGGRDYETYLSELSNKVQELQDQKGTLSSSEYMFRRYVQKLQQNDPCCPLCRRNFSAEEEVVELIKELTLKVRELPSKLRGNKQQLDKIQEEYKNLLQLKPKYEKLSVIKNSDIPELESAIKKIDQKLETANEELAVLLADLVVPQNDESLAKRIQGDIILLEQYFTDCRRISWDIQKLESKLPSGSCRSLKEAMTERKEIRESLQTARHRVESLQKKKTDIISKRHRMQEEKNKIQDQQIKISGNIQMRSQLSEKRDELESLEVVMQMELDTSIEESAKISRQLEQSVRQMKSLVSNNMNALDKFTTKVRRLQQQLGEIKKLHSSIGDYEKSGGSSKLTTSQEYLASLEKKGDTLQGKKDSICEQKDKIKSHLASQKVRERELDDNKKLRIKIKEESELNDKVVSMKMKIGNLDYVSLRKEKEKLKKEEDAINTERTLAEGRQRELFITARSLRDDLNKDQYKNADKKYRDTMIDKKLAEVTADDLLKYFSAMEWALLHFHQERMRNINEIIDELWKQIYRGNDIDTIKIVADTSETGDRRKTYNYRVMLEKRGIELEMRGRCSAGQKVLACLIIRMALAETFSTNCGVLALDEPTTNLDEKNIESLSDVLSEIVLNRMNQKNFQLILITHDHNFLNKLTNLDEITHYFEVKRNTEGKSVIDKVIIR